MVAARSDNLAVTWRFLVSQSQGAPLGIVQRALLDPFFPRMDLSDVRVHRDEPSDRAARSLRADAFSLGSHLFFRAGRFNTSTAAGLALLGHELSHTRQIVSGEPARTVAERRQLEQEAESTEATLLRAFTIGRPLAEQKPPMTSGRGDRYVPVSLAHARPIAAAASQESVPREGRGSVARGPVTSGDSRTSHPLKADEGRVAAAGPGTTTASASPSDDPDSVMRAMLRTFERKLRTERERKGVDRWVP
jgi:hypothetical protein